MAKPKLSNLLVFGVDMGPLLKGTRWSDHSAFGDRLLRIFERYQIAATWGLPSPAGDFLSRLKNASMKQEVALQWTAPPMTERSAAFRVAAEIRESLEQAKERGLVIQALVADPRGKLPYQAVAKAGIRTIRPSRTRASRRVCAVQPQAMRYGIWGLPVSCFWPQPNRVLQMMVARQLGSRVRSEMMTHVTTHLVFDMPHLVRGSDPSLSQVDRLMDHVAQQNVRIGRLSDVERMVRIETSARPTRSILRRQAA